MKLKPDYDFLVAEGIISPQEGNTLRDIDDMYEVASKAQKFTLKEYKNATLTPLPDKIYNRLIASFEELNQRRLSINNPEEAATLT